MSPAAVKILVAVISAVAVVTAGYFGYKATLKKDEPTKESKRFPVQVLSNTDNRPLQDADVSLGVLQVLPERTDNRGQVHFTIPSDLIGKDGQLSVTKEGFESYREHIILQDKATFYGVYLRPTVAPPPPTPQQIVRTYSSGPRASGSRRNFSDWYEQCSLPEPGYKVETSEFVLQGDRACGAWSECQLASRTDDRVCYRFRMQGHDEWLFNSGQANSEGILKVTWTKR